jgi:hypothetical protein
MEKFFIQVNRVVNFGDGTLYIEIVPTSDELRDIVMYGNTLPITNDIQSTIDSELLVAKPIMFSKIPVDFLTKYEL